MTFTENLANSKFQEFETVLILKIQKKRPNLNQKTLPKINKQKNQQKTALINCNYF